MPNSALKRLYEDLKRVDDRSPYEDALFREIRELSRKTALPTLWIDSTETANNTNRLNCSYHKCPNKAR